MSETPVAVALPKRDYLTIALGLVITLLFAGALVGSLGMPRGARLMPMAISVLGLIFCAIGMVRFLRAPQAPAEEEAGGNMGEGTDVTPAAAARYGAWMAGYVVGLWLFGLIVSTAVFTALFLRVERRSPVLSIIFVTGITLGTAMLLGWLLNIRWPAGLLIPR
jgi:FtsH-binding integral membrane protein